MEKNKPAILWSNSYSVGVQEIDEQHKLLIEILNELIAFVYNSPGNENLDIRATIDKIVKYKTVHFETEEKYFKQFNFEGADEHIQKHREFNEKVSELLQEFQKNGKKSELSELVDFMENWFTDHLLHMDQKYIKCFKENGLK
jgi:hemerythrin